MKRESMILVSSSISQMIVRLKVQEEVCYG